MADQETIERYCVTVRETYLQLSQASDPGEKLGLYLRLMDAYTSVSEFPSIDLISAIMEAERLVEENPPLSRTMLNLEFMVRQADCSKALLKDCIDQLGFLGSDAALNPDDTIFAGFEIADEAKDESGEPKRMSAPELFDLLQDHRDQAVYHYIESINLARILSGSPGIKAEEAQKIKKLNEKSVMGMLSVYGAECGFYIDAANRMLDPIYSALQDAKDNSVSADSDLALPSPEKVDKAAVLQYLLRLSGEHMGAIENLYKMASDTHREIGILASKLKLPQDYILQLNDGHGKGVIALNEKMERTREAMNSVNLLLSSAN